MRDRDRWPIRPGYTYKWTVTLRDTDGNILTGTYDGSETLTVAVVDAAGRSVSLGEGSSAAWLVASAGTVMITLDNADTTNLRPGRYSVQVGITVSGEPYLAYNADLYVDVP